jgi:hypothetical protein
VKWRLIPMERRSGAMDIALPFVVGEDLF